jgi:SAM-dependent methyltransferase/3-polyprenyl-4-hydroxybenzoate decarboxylase
MEPASVRLARARTLRAVDEGSNLLLFGQGRPVRRLDGDSAALARVVLDFTAEPHSRAEILAHVTALAGGFVEQPAVVDELVSLLLQGGQLEPAVTQPRSLPLAGVRVVLGISGAIASVETPALALTLMQQGAELRVAATRAAGRFVRFAALEALTHQPVHASLWGMHPSAPVPHIDLAAWADLVLICPASATTLSRIARGDCSDVVAATAVATRAPVVLAPSMNARMYLAPSTQRNLAMLREDGFFIVHPGRGAEVAHHPRARVPILGPAPGPGELVEIVMLLLKVIGGHTRHRAPQGAREWDALYSAGADSDLSWHCDRLDEDIAAALADLASDLAAKNAAAPTRAQRLLDVGTGLGTVAIDAARRGFNVVATDISPHALTRAQTRADGLPVTWLEDDITGSHIRGQFDVVIDRGCLHLLPADRWPRYAENVSRLTSPGGTLLLKLDSPTAQVDRHTHRFTAEELRALLSPAFELVRATPSVLARDGATGDAVLYEFRRTSGSARESNPPDPG